MRLLDLINFQTMRNHPAREQHTTDWWVLLVLALNFNNHFLNQSSLRFFTTKEKRSFKVLDKNNAHLFIFSLSLGT